MTSRVESYLYTNFYSTVLKRGLAACLTSPSDAMSDGYTNITYLTSV